MSSLSCWHKVPANPGIKADKAAMVAHSQAQKIGICHLSMSQDARPVQGASLQQTVIIGNEQMCRRGHGLRQAIGYGLDRQSLAALRHLQAEGCLSC